MSVSIRNIALTTMMVALSGTAAQAGCCGSGGSNGVTNIPVITGPSNGCCGPVTSHPVGVPGVFVPAPNVSVVTGGPNIGGVNVGVGGPTIGGVNVGVGGPTFIGGGTSNVFGGGSSNVYVGGGGGYISSPSPTTPGLIEALNVGGQAAEQFQETRTATETVAIRAVCMDDKGMPHPASRPVGDANVAQGFNGEVFRCMAGTRMEVTLGKVVNGQPVFDGGRTISCQKGHALVQNGTNLVCAPQTAAANCNERSLLRRFGPGIRYATITTTQTVTSTRQAATSFRSSMFVDGGVGQGVY
jgi:hypothetical protein